MILKLLILFSFGECKGKQKNGQQQEESRYRIGEEDGNEETNAHFETDHPLENDFLLRNRFLEKSDTEETTFSALKSNEFFQPKEMEIIDKAINEMTEKKRGTNDLSNDNLNVMFYSPREIQSDQKQMIKVKLENLSSTVIYCKFDNVIKHAKISVEETIYCKVLFKSKKNEDKQKRRAVTLSISSDKINWVLVGELVVIESSKKIYILIFLVIGIGLFLSFTKGKSYILKRFKWGKSGIFYSKQNSKSIL